MATEYGSGGSISVTMDGPFAGSSGGGAKIATISAPAESWKGGESPFSQVVAVDGVTVTSKVDVQLSDDQIQQFTNRIIAFRAVNDTGVITLYAYGSMPDTDMEIQATISEVVGEGIIWGNIFPAMNPQADYSQTDPTKADYIKNKPDAAIAQALQKADDAMEKAEAALPKAGGTMTGNIDMGGQQIKNMAEPISDGDGVTLAYLKSYADGRYLSADVTLTADGWSDSAPYTQTLALAGVLATDRPHFGVVYTENWEAEKEAFSLVDQLDTADGSLTFTCFAERPEADLTIGLEVNR